MEGYKKPNSPIADSNPSILGALSGFYQKLTGQADQPTGDEAVPASAPAELDPYEQAAQTLSKTAQNPKGQEFMKNNPFQK